MKLQSLVLFGLLCTCMSSAPAQSRAEAPEFPFDNTSELGVPWEPQVSQDPILSQWSWTATEATDQYVGDTYSVDPFESYLMLSDPSLFRSETDVTVEETDGTDVKEPEPLPVAPVPMQVNRDAPQVAPPPRPVAPPKPKAPPTKNCCICEYEEWPDCETLPQKEIARCGKPECSDGIDNDADGKIDLRDPDCGDAWYRDSEKGEKIWRDCRLDANNKCKGSAFLDCQEWLATNDKCDVKKIIPRGEDVIIALFGEEQCASTRFKAKGHASPAECKAFAGQVMSCALCTGPNCEIFASHDGCKVFRNIKEVEASAAKIQKLMKPGQKLTMTASQGLTPATKTAAGICTNPILIELAIDSRTFKYSRCSPPGTRCLGKAESLVCSIETMRDGKPSDGLQNESCCCDANNQNCKIVDNAFCPKP